MSAVCGSHLQTSVADEVDQTSAVCKKKIVCFLTYAKCQITPNNKKSKNYKSEN
ncbi:hypothetical protein Hanom_Chr16g01478961 [Helianthus anomalus]